MPRHRFRGPFEPPFLSYADVIAAHGRDRPNDVAFVQGDERLTWRDFDRATNQVAHALRRDGLRKGDAVAVLATNVPWAYLVAYGIMKAGGVFTPLSPLLTPALLAQLIADAGARKLFVSQSLLELALAAERLGATVGMVIDGVAPPTRRSFAAFLGDAADTAPDVTLDPGDRCNII
jgi:acyl-CoA synthetase (AMP-forming)/AMP-acid ligase II